MKSKYKRFRIVQQIPHHGAPSEFVLWGKPRGTFRSWVQIGTHPSEDAAVEEMKSLAEYPKVEGAQEYWADGSAEYFW